MEGGRVSHSWCMGVVSHGYGGLGGGRDGVDTLMTPPSRFAALGIAELELVGLPGKTFTQEATRRLQFIVHAADWLHSMVFHPRLASVPRSTLAGLVSFAMSIGIA